jgi:hypothetical protein
VTRPAPKTPRPITDDSKVGHLYVTCGFWLHVDPEMDPPEAIDEDLTRELRLWGEYYGLTDLHIGIRVHGAAGERSEHEGTIGLTEDIERAPLRADVPVKGERL